MLPLISHSRMFEVATDTEHWQLSEVLEVRLAASRIDIVLGSTAWFGPVSEIAQLKLRGSFRQLSWTPRNRNLACY